MITAKIPHPKKQRLHKTIMWVLILAFLVSASISCKAENTPADQKWDELVAPYRHFMEMGSYRMHYIDIGKGEPVLLIHGFADSTYCWHKNVKPILDAGFRVILVDIPGLGQSDIPPDDFSLGVVNLGEQIIHFTDQMKLERFDLVGSSLGGAVGLYLCLNYSDRIKKSILFDPACFPQKKQGFLSLMDIPGASHLMGRWSIKTALKDVYYNADLVDETLIHEYARPMSKPGYKAFLVRLLKDFDSEEAATMSTRYSEIHTPLLIVWGDHDKWVPPEFGPRLQGMVEGSRFLSIQNAGHLPHQERPDIVNPLLVGFLSE